MKQNLICITILLLTPFSLRAQTLAGKDLEMAKKSIEALIRPLIPVKSKSPVATGFRVDQCEKYQAVDWREILLQQKDITLEFKFKEGCDIQGTISPRIFSPFPASLNLRNLQRFKKVESQNKITSTLESRPIMNLDILSGTLTDHLGKILFEGEYRVQINPLSKENFLEKNLGGEIRIKQIYGQKVSITQKIMVD
jgi:hypothetical protein